MGLSPHEFFSMDIEDFILKSNGFFDARLWQERNYRRLAEVLQRPHVTSKAPSMMDQWPLAKDNELKKQVREYISKANEETLKAHKQGGFEYVMEKGKIIMKKISQN